MTSVQLWWHNPFCKTEFLVGDEISKDGGLLLLHTSMVWEISVPPPDSTSALGDLWTSKTETFQDEGSVLGMGDRAHDWSVCVWVCCICPRILSRASWTFWLMEESVSVDSGLGWWFLVKLESCSRTCIWRSIMPSMVQWKALCSASCSPRRWFNMVSCCRMRLLVSSEVPAKKYEDELCYHSLALKLWFDLSSAIICQRELNQHFTWKIILAAVSRLSCTVRTVGIA